MSTRPLSLRIAGVIATATLAVGLTACGAPSEEAQTSFAQELEGRGFSETRYESQLRHYTTQVGSCRFIVDNGGTSARKERLAPIVMTDVGDFPRASLAQLEEVSELKHCFDE